jgi:hypothetical protein
MSVPALICRYPDFIPLDLNLKDILHPRLSLTEDGVSEFTFAGLYLFRNRYKYRISQESENGGFIISGEKEGKRFFMTPCCAPEWETLEDLFKTHDYWKNIPESVLSSARTKYAKNGQDTECGITFNEDRDNFDYLYYRTELAELAGKKFHKKKNHVNHFIHTYPQHEQKQMTVDLVPAAVEVLDQWHHDTMLRNVLIDDGDYKAAKESLDLFDTLNLKGQIYFVDGKPAAYCLGESVARGKMFAIHFEKGVEEYKGIYQYMNQAFASSLPRFFTLINREQDLGNEGLRQAKMTYRPCDFVKKYTGRLS